MNSAFFRLLLWTMLLSAITGQFGGLRAHAQDNPFGFPEPIDAQKVGSVMLHGGGNGVRDYVRQEFLRLAGGSDARVVLLPSDYEQREPGETLEAYEERLSRPGGLRAVAGVVSRQSCPFSVSSLELLPKIPTTHDSFPRWRKPPEFGCRRRIKSGSSSVLRAIRSNRLGSSWRCATSWRAAESWGRRAGEWRALPRPSSPGTPTTKMPAGLRLDWRLA